MDGKVEGPFASDGDNAEYWAAVDVERAETDDPYGAEEMELAKQFGQTFRESISRQALTDRWDAEQEHRENYRETNG